MKPNPQQLLVVDHFEGPCLVMAVPGSGKTASVTERTKRLVEKGVDPHSILAITFTNKAATEMRTRIATAVGPRAALMTISTFHSLCSKLIRANCELLGLTKSYTIYDTDQQERLLKTCIRKIEEATGPKFKISDAYRSQVLGFIEGKRNGCLTDIAAAEKYNLSGNQLKVCVEYFDQLKKSNAVDFTGLLSETIRLFDEQPAVRDKYRARFRFISVDEVQDTNIAQYELIKHLGLGHKNVLMVGDLDQSIYKFRNANPENILQFEKDFSGCKILMLEKNYRSTPSILRHSQNLIDNNLLRKGTKLSTDNADGEAPRIWAGETDYNMAEIIASNIKERIASGIKPKEIAILYRTNYASRVLESSLRRQNIKYKIIGGLSFWDRKECKTSLSILKLMCNDNDRMAFETSCEECCKGVGDKTLAVIAENASASTTTILSAARTFSENGTAIGSKLKPFISAIDGSRGMPPGDALLKVATETALMNDLRKDSTTTNDRCANVAELAQDVNAYCSSAKNTLSGYLQTLALATEDEDDNDNVVKLMTLHGCKGLEFDVVYVSHCLADLLPHARLAEEFEEGPEYDQAVEEERRLLYVGMTRARKHLTLLFSVWKLDARSKAPRMTYPSQFLFETGIKSVDLEKYRFGADPTRPPKNEPV